jgi:hypothetical protein
MIIFVKIIVYWWLLGYLKLFCPMVKDMDNNEENSQEEKKLKLDLREALTNGSDDDDDIIELKDEVTLPPKEKEAKIDLSDSSGRESPGDEPAEETVRGLNTLGFETAEPENVIHQVDELIFEEEDESEEDEEIQPHLFEKPLVMDGSDGVIEVTEFDDILSEDDNEMITLADEDEEEFLELIDVEEDSFPEEAEEEEDKTVEIKDEIIQFDGLKEEIEDVELEDFINDSLNEEIRTDDDLEDDLTSSLGVETGSERNMLDQASEAEDLDFNIDSSEISEKIDQLDTIFSDDTEAQTDFEDEMVSNDEELEEAVSFTDDTYTETEDEEIRITDDEPSEETVPEPGIAAFDADHDKIEESIERIIQQNFSEKIESMVVEVIEKAVSKEIDRLKNILLENDSPESS